MTSLSAPTFAVTPYGQAAGPEEVEAGADLFVIDMEAPGSAELLRHLVWIATLAQADFCLPSRPRTPACSDVYVILRKPITVESGSRSLRSCIFQDAAGFPQTYEIRGDDSGHRNR